MTTDRDRERLTEFLESPEPSDPRPPAGARSRPHSGRRRNEQVRSAILDAALVVAADPGRSAVTVEAIARLAGVGKQTIYRWWRSPYEVLGEALGEYAAHEVPVPATGDLRSRLTAFLTATFLKASSPTTAGSLRAIVTACDRDPAAARLLSRFTAERRKVLRGLFAGAVDRGELPGDADLDLLTDQAFGVLWYRLLVGHAPLDEGTARRLAQALVRQAGTGS